MTTQKFHTNFKAITIKTEVFNNTDINEIVPKYYIIIDVVYDRQGKTVTLIYQDQTTITEFNLRQMSSTQLKKLCEQNEIPLTIRKPVNVPLNKSDVIEIMEKEEKDAKYSLDESDYWKTRNKWQFIRSNLDSLFADNKWRKTVFIKRNLPYYKKVDRTVQKTKEQLIYSLMHSYTVYQLYGFNIVQF